MGGLGEWAAGGETRGAWLAFLNDEGLVTAQRQLWLNSYVCVAAITTATTGDLVVGGEILTPNSDSSWDLFAASMSASEDRWLEKHGGRDVERGGAIAASGDGFCITGQSMSVEKGKSRALTLRLGKDGKAIWSRSSGVGYVRPPVVVATADEGAVVAGSDDQPSAWAVRYRSNGEVAWSKTWTTDEIGGAYISPRISLCSGERDEIILCVPASSGGGGSFDWNTWWMRLDATGGVLSKKRIDDIYVTGVGKSATSCVLYGSVATVGNERRIGIVRLDESGNTVWRRTHLVPQGHEWTLRNGVSDGAGGVILVGVDEWSATER